MGMQAKTPLFSKNRNITLPLFHLLLAAHRNICFTDFPGSLFLMPPIGNDAIRSLSPPVTSSKLTSMEYSVSGGEMRKVA